jgi:hypothetical protein
MSDDRYDEGSERLPFGGGGADDDLFVWDGLRPPSRPADLPPRPVPDEPRRARLPAESRPSRDEGAVRPRRAAPSRGADDEWQDWLDPGEGAQAGGP